MYRQLNIVFLFKQGNLFFCCRFKETHFPLIFNLFNNLF